ncbi:MAG: UPF0339 protein [Candidatus Roseilinea sp.]|nr:MAG: UPF0339 protein [Candidatus Roseilinea sp.]
MSGKFELKTSNNGEYMFNLIASNGRVIFTGETYTERRSALNGIESVRTNAPLDERFERRMSSSGQPYFVLKAANGTVIGRSQMYSSTAAMEKGIASVKHHAPDATLVDLTAQ